MNFAKFLRTLFCRTPLGKWFEPTVSNNENRDGEVSSSAMQTKRVEKERKGNLDCCLCGKCKAMSTNAESSGA